MDNQNEKTFLDNYLIEDYERPSVATDIALFSLKTDDGVDYRNDPMHKISMLLIRRGEHPYKDCWALPGGFLRKGETLEECAFRELKEETGLQPENMMWVSAHSKPDRDPRGWVISHSCVGLFTENQASLISSTDAKEAAWFQVELNKTAEDSFLLELKHEEITINVELQTEYSRMSGTCFKVIKNDSLAFDHGAIIAESIQFLKKQAEDIRVVFDFLPEKFTLSTLQKVHETLLGITHLTPNFRRKIANYVEETDEYTEGAGHRPARLFRRKQDL